MADRGDPDVLEVARRELPQHLGVDVVVAERLLIALHPQLSQPSVDVHPAPARQWRRGHYQDRNCATSNPLAVSLP